MTDIASIVIAVLSSVGTLLLGVAGFIYTRSSDEHKARSEAEKLVAKYRDPLLLASHDLQSRLYSIVDLSVVNWLHGNDEEKESLRLYTAFLVGQYLSWTYILRRQVQFLRFSTDKTEKNKRLVEVLAKISDTFSTDAPHKELNGAEFKLWRNQQLAIGELMTVTEGGELYCIGNAAFCHKYKEDITTKDLQRELSRDTDTTVYLHAHNRYKEPVPPDQDEAPRNPSQEFRDWFRPLISGINKVASQKLLRAKVPDRRMRRLQHLLLDLMEVLDLEKSGIGGNNTNRCHRAAKCDCSKCKNTKACPCNRKNECRITGAEESRPEPQRAWPLSWLRLKELKSLSRIKRSPAEIPA